MTIALQYQYKSLTVKHENFEVSLSFGGKYEKISVPYKSVTSFADPSVNFVLKFSMGYGDLEEIESEDYNESNQANKSKTEIDLSAKVVSLEAFRKNRNINSDPDNNA